MDIFDAYYSPFLLLFYISYGVLLYSASKPARYFAYAGITSYLLGLMIGVYCGY